MRIIVPQVISEGQSSGPVLPTVATTSHSSVKTEPFGHGVVLLNPAIEANQVLQLKELVAERCYANDQPKLLHVISTSADYTTHNLFPLGASAMGP